MKNTPHGLACAGMAFIAVSAAELLPRPGGGERRLRARHQTHHARACPSCAQLAGALLGVGLLAEEVAGNPMTWALWVTLVSAALCAASATVVLVFQASPRQETSRQWSA